MSRPESYKPTVTTPLLIDSQTTPAASATSGTGANGSAIYGVANGSSRTNPNPNSTSLIPTPAVDKVAIHSRKYVGRHSVGERSRRKWEVAVTVNGQPERITNLVDPFSEEQYYRSDSERIQRGKLQDLNRARAREYFEELFNQLGLSCCQKTNCRISIHEDVTKITPSSNSVSLHSLLWEVLEHSDFWPRVESGGKPTKRVRLSRTLNVLSNGSNTLATGRQASNLTATQAEYRVLLIIARSFKKSSDQSYVDYKPSLIQGPLLNIARRTKERGITPKLHIDVVRPGTVEELDEYLKPGREKPYDIVHFDLHGKIGPTKLPARSRVRSPPPDGSPSPERQSYLRFAKPYDPELHRFKAKDNEIEMLLTDDTSLHDVPVKQIAEKLQKSRITKVALSACLSSYAQSQIFLNMCYTLLSHDVAEVSAMSFQILESTAQVYYSAFYESLILHGEAFHVAAARGREALRANHLQYGHAVLPTNYHRYPRSFSNEWWRSPNVDGKGPPPSAWYLVRYAVVFFLLLVLCLAYLWLPSFFFYILLPIAFAITTASWLLTARQLERLTPTITTEQTYKQHHEKSKRRATFEVDIEHLVIEDRLKSEANRGALYVWSTDYSKELSDCVHDLAQMWVLTGFVDKVDIISAHVFSWTLTSLPLWRWFRTRRYRSNRVGTIGRRRLLVIKEFDRFYPKYARDCDGIGGDGEGTHLRAGLRRMCSFIEGYDQEDTYLLITGSYDEDWWTDSNRYNDERIVNTLVRAVPHNHNITPARRHISKWSMPVVERRWSTFWGGMFYH